jgi:hypothetical protein
MMTLPRYLVIVRAGDTELFEALKAQLAREPYPVGLIWDRRGGDRRTRPGSATDERRTEERRVGDAMWEEMGFRVTETNALPPDATMNRVASLMGDIGAGQPLSNGQRLERSLERSLAVRMFARHLEAALRDNRLGRDTAR